MSENPYARHARQLAEEEPSPAAAAANPFAVHAKAQGDALYSSAIAAADRDPDQFARAQQIAKRTGYPVEVVADNHDEFEQRDARARLDALRQDAPQTATFLSDPRRMALAKDDTEQLARVEQTLKRTGVAHPLPEPSLVEELASQAHSAWIRGKNYVETFLFEPLLPDMVDDGVARGLGHSSAEDYAATRTATRYASENRRAAGGERLSIATQAQQSEVAAAKGWSGAAEALATNPRALAVTIAQSLGQGTPALAAAAAGATLGPWGTAAGAGGGSFAVEYGNAIATAMHRAGVDDSDPASVKAFLTSPAKMRAARSYATRRGVPIALFDAATARFAGQLLSAARPGVVSTTVRAAGEAGVQAGGGALGELTAQVASGDPINPTDILTEAFAEIPTAAAEAPGNLATARRNARAASTEAMTLLRSSEDAARLQEFTEGASQSRLGERSAEDLEAFVAASGEQHVYLDAETARTLFQSADLDPEETAAALTGNPQALDEATAAGGDLAIPAGRWATLIAKLPTASEFSRHARFSPDALSAAELADYDITALAQASEPTPDAGATTSAQRVEDDVAAMLSATGGYSPADIERQAKVYGAFFRTLSHRLGADAWDLYEPFGLSIQREPGSPMKRIVGSVQNAARRAGLGKPHRTPARIPQGNRGLIRIQRGQGIQIELLRDADATTFIHESGHFFWEVFSEAAQRPDATESVQRDYRAALEWFGVSTADELTVEHMEQWARGFEHYTAEGKAPSRELQSVFARFRAWMLDVYRDLRKLDVELSDDIRRVFDRLLAVDEEIELASRDAGPLDLGAEPKALGLTEKQWADYVAQTAASREDALAEVTAQAMASRSAEALAWREEQREEIRQEIERDIDSSPGAKAARILSGEAEAESDKVPAELRNLKLDRKAVEAAYGPEVAAAEFRPLGILRDGGANPETVAALLDFQSADAMLQAIRQATERRARLEEEVQQQLDERHPEAPLGDVSQTAERAVNSRRSDALDTELAMLAQLAKQPKPNRRVLRAVAAEIIAKRPIGQIRPNEFLVAERRAARRAARAAGRGEYGAALVAKRQQALNSALYSEANAVTATVERQVNFARDMGRPTSRKRLGKAGILGAFEQVMELYSFKPVSDKQRERAATLRGWYDRMLVSGIDPQVPEAVMRQIDASRLTHYRDLTAGQLEEVIEVLRLLDHQAKEASELRLAGDRLDLDQSAHTLSAAVRSALKDRGPPPASEVLAKKLGNRARSVIRSAGAMLLRLRTLANWVDGEGRVDGPFYRYVVRPLDRAQASYLDAMDTYGQKVIDLFETHLKGRELSRPIWIASIHQNLTKSDILAVALNTGNASNLQRMQDGRGWGDIQMMEILGHMEKADWDFVQAVWDTLESLWPQIAAQQQRLTGIEPPKVEARQVKTPFGLYAGGYYPLVYDRDSTQWRAFVNAETDSFFDPLALTALPPNGHTKERVQKARLPVKLDLAVIPGHLSAILKDLTHRETVIGIRKLMKHDKVVAAMSDTAGPQFLDMVEDKLRQVATDQVAEMGRALSPIRLFSRGVRRHVGLMAQGFNVISGVKQLIGAANSLEVMTKRHGASGAALLADAYGRMFQRGTVDAVMALSGEMRHRLNTADVDIRLNMQRYLSGQMAGDLKGKLSSAHDGAVAHAYIVIRYMQTYAVDLPLWIAAHEGALKKGLAGDDAIAAADDAVITAQGAGGAKDTALIEGQVPFLEWLTMFYSYASAFLNRQVTMGREVGKSVEGGLPRLAAEMPLLAARAVFLFIVPVILDDLVNQLTNAEDGPGDEESWASYYSKRAAAYQFYGLPFLRDLAGANYSYRLSPAQSIGDAWHRLSENVERKLGGKEVSARRAVRDAVNATGYTLGLPLQGPWRHVDYLWRVVEGEEQPESVPEFAGALLTAKREDR
jgi:hypothetical protein